MRFSKTLATFGLIGVLALAGCGGDDDDTDASSDATEAGAPDDASEETDDPAATDETQPADDDASGAVEVPDPCTLLSEDAIAAVIGEEPGDGTAATVDPTQRKTCTYDNGLILSVEIADNYGPSVELIRQNSQGSTIEDVTGVGNAAIWQEFGNTGIGQFVAQGDQYFVAASVGTGREQAQTLVEQMLTAVSAQ